MSQPSVPEESIFLQALEIKSAEDRAAYLEQACGANHDLRVEVEALLRAHEQSGDLLDLPDKLNETQGEISTAAKDSEALGFLAPSDKPGVLGRLGHYEVLEVIGKGGMGIVLRAFDEKLHRVVAIKVMAPSLAANATARKRFIREAQAAAAVRNDYVIDIHAVEEASETPYLVMEYISGLSLQERLDQTGPLELNEILRIGMQTALGLAAAHAQGLIHRDIKPANILLENGVERVKITDFGLARAADASLTQSGMVAGTPHYMSPEQARGEAVDRRTDLFSLGSVLYAMATGRAPFRASGSMAVLKRVCEETPRPIRETNPEIPDWLVAVIDKLHAKDPAQRYQSAAEVAELLNGHLAQLQHPSVVGQVSNLPPDPKAGWKPAPRRRRLALAAAVLLCFVAGLSLTEATGVTNLRATVIRIFTPDGTLVVEVDDPAVKVTIEGDGGLVITGAGLEEIRLRPGSYKLHADKDGKRVPLERELISIAKGGREVVRVKLEAPPAPAAAKADKGAFMVLGRNGIEVRKYDTLAEAVRGANDGDTIEVRGNGPFASEPIHINKTALTIRAGAGFRPVIMLRPGDVTAFGLLVTHAPLVLEGLELQRMNQESSKDANAWQVIVYTYAPFYAANCRFVSKLIANGISSESPVCELRNCEILCPDSSAVVWGNAKPGARLVIDNCVQALGQIIIAPAAPDAKGPIFFQLSRNTCLTQLRYHFELEKWQGALKGDERTKLLSVEASGNVLDASSTLFDLQIDKVAPDSETVAFLTHRVGWRGDSNLFSTSGSFLSFGAPGKAWEPTIGIKSLADWKKFWGSAEAGSIEAQPRYQGGDLRSKLRATPEKLTSDDFRLRPDSAGYRAGKDGKDLGADVDLVGPGPAYERWKKTPEYQQWLKDTGQVKKAEAPRAEPQAFVVLGGKAIEVRKYDTLAEAVQGASDGDTIEIRGNGPFVTQPISIKQALTIRASEGFRPVIKANPEEEQGKNLLNTNAPLVLEGLDFQWVEAKAFDPTDGRLSCLVVTSGPTSRLHVANCRFLMNRRTGPNAGMLCIGGWGMAICRLRNCQFLVGGSLNFVGIPQSEVTVENCLLIGGVALPLTHAEPMRVVMKRNTSLGSHSLTLSLGNKIDPPGEKDSRPLQWETSANILDGQVQFGQFADYLAKEKALSAREAEQLLTRLIGWRENRNLYLLPEDSDLLRLIAAMTPGQATLLPPTAPIKTMADWKRFWGMAELDSLRGQARFQGGDLIAKAGLTPELLTPEDFRLRPDSAGYRAGKDGKDLGADVDLVGPGPAYERWKKTPEYQQWLKETGQRK